ncbi:MAG TPA: phosphatase PAP2 family protein [Propionibacteriaceae bacterium]|jgi:membrane-associated phospholipid phosphatase|nr:phosphatase PAP2 family protein [Propionibacteriaceae bacterium]
MTMNSLNRSAAAGPSATASPRQGRRRLDRRWILGATAASSAIAFLLLSLVVAAGLTQPLDDVTRETFRPGDRWGATQTRFGYMVDGLSPLVTGPLLAIGSAIAAWRDRSLRPLIFAGATGSVAVAATLAAKAAMDRSDGHGDLHGMATSYPSGHMVMLLISAGCLLLLFVPQVRWLWAALGVVGVMMGISILVVAMHWLTDVVASALLGVVLLAGAALFQGRLPRARTEVQS